MQDRDIQEDITVEQGCRESNPKTVLYQAALIIKALLETAEGIGIYPLDPTDISLAGSSDIVASNLYTFLYWVLAPSSLHSMPVDCINKDDVKEQNGTLHRHILSVGQDLVYIASKGKCKTPKHVSVGVAMHQMTQSKDVIQILNRYGHCVSYDEVLRIDTSWADWQLGENRTLVPANMVPGKITRGAGDNFNRATQSLHGDHHDVVNMVLYQEIKSEEKITTN